MTFERLSRENGHWQLLWRNWDALCETYNEAFTEFAPSALTVLKPLAEDPQLPHAGVFGLLDGPNVLAVCQLNVAALPGYDDKVLRLRHLVLSPEFDFSDAMTLERYVDVLSQMFTGAVEVASTEMPAKHIKLHFRSPADRQFFNQFKDTLSTSGAFKTVQMSGAWLYLSRD